MMLRTGPSARSSSPPVDRNHRNDFYDSESDDPHHIRERFVDNHRIHFAVAMQEIHDGRKESCWSWFLIPTAPYIVDGVERGSHINRMFALRGDDAVDEYLTFHKKKQLQRPNEGMAVVNLRDNYVQLLKAIHLQLKNGTTLNELLGEMDAIKAMSSFQLFFQAGKRLGDTELSAICASVLQLCGHGQYQQDEQKPPPRSQEQERRLYNFFSGGMPKLRGTRGKKE